MARRSTLPLLLGAAAVARVAADNLSCNGTGMDWYINMVGETPCQTYQSLRQICNSNYQVGVQNVNTPPDGCTDQVSSCCCNTIAFSLSMLCLNCQQNIGTGSGYDAGVGAYTDYLNGCSNPQSKQLPSDIQTAVCNEKLKIDDDIYTNAWPDGSWFYIYTSETIQKDNIVANNNSFTHCASTTVNTTSALGSSTSSTSSAKSSPSSAADNTPVTTTKKIASGAIAGIAVGAVIVGLAVAAALWWFCYYRRRHGRDMRAGMLENPLGDGMTERPRDRRTMDESLAAHAYTYTSGGQTTATSDYFAASVSESGTRSDGPTSSSGPGFAGLGAGTAVGYGLSDTASTGPTSPRRGFHTAGQPSTSNVSLVQADAGGSARATSSSDSSGRGGRPQAGPLPRKRGAGGSGHAPPQGAQAPRVPGRRDSEEPFLEAEGQDEWTSSERHRDGGPVSDVSLGRSASGRLPPAYGEQI
ncbi:hypothetical protein MSAN_00636600 [Mycena sanguinolenta]|uniref:Mid2 domain-containing protein n=1 Tax=Mycena sanguinolenta TaxID=230812 RepID=A0A8H6Z494_9AGAR|nr:hypothetical protein MSAN_00636600 [Mycena sanguinolenta]